MHDCGDLWLLYAVTAVYGFSYTLIGSGQSAMLAVLLPEDELADANAVRQTVREGLRLVAPLAGVPQMVSIAAGALLVTVVDYRLLLLAEATVVAAVGAWLLTRAAQGVAASH